MRDKTMIPSGPVTAQGGNPYDSSFHRRFRLARTGEGDRLQRDSQKLCIQTDRETVHLVQEVQHAESARHFSGIGWKVDRLGRRLRGDGLMSFSSCGSVSKSQVSRISIIQIQPWFQRTYRVSFLQMEQFLFIPVNPGDPSWWVEQICASRQIHSLLPGDRAAK
jgi:hypothetical protein